MAYDKPFEKPLGEVGLWKNRSGRGWSGAVDMDKLVKLATDNPGARFMLFLDEVTSENPKAPALRANIKPMAARGDADGF